MDRSENMRRVKSRNTGIELWARSILWPLGVRYRLHKKNLPGSPDIYVPRLRVAIFLNGCFWHGHDCRRGRLPTRNKAFWKDKINQNRRRDLTNENRLLTMDIEPLILWSCQEAQNEVLLRELACRYYEGR